MPPPTLGFTMSPLALQGESAKANYSALRRILNFNHVATRTSNEFSFLLWVTKLLLDPNLII